jgi:hypothetical protein
MSAAIGDKRFMKIDFRKIIGAGLLLGLLCVQSVPAQCTNKTGKLNVWTTAPVVRDENSSASFKEMRVAKQKGFDRVVFEFAENVPNFSVHFEKPPITNYGGEDLKMSGKAFVVVQFHLVSYPEDADTSKIVFEIPRNKLKAPVVTEIKNSEWFEGYLSFAIGLRKRTPFRVQQLSNPARLVIDFKQ